jgi:hypothetical protein
MTFVCMQCKVHQQLKLIQMHMYYKRTIVINKNACDNSNDQYNTIFHKSIGKNKLWGVRINCSGDYTIVYSDFEYKHPSLFDNW